MIKFETKLDSQAVTSLTKHNIKKLWWLYVLFSVVFVLIGVVNMFGEEADFIFGTVMIVVGVLFTPLCIALSFSMVKKQSKTMPVLSNETVETYVFDYDGFTLTQIKGDEYRSDLKAKYSYFFKVVSTSTHYYLYMSSQQCHVIPKNTLIEGSLGELDDIFARNLGGKFFTK